MVKVIFTVGIPASGKSTWSKQFVLDNPDFIRVSRDDLCRMRGKYLIPKQEDYITMLETAGIEFALQYGFSVVVDATNLNRDRIDRFIEKLKIHTPCNDFEFRIFDINLKKAIHRDSLRSNDESVGSDVINRMYIQFIKNKWNERKQ